MSHQAWQCFLFCFLFFFFCGASGQTQDLVHAASSLPLSQGPALEGEF
jgi:hypothetical protein